MNRRLAQFERLLQPCSDEQLEAMAVESRGLTRRYFGSVIRLFAPLYLSNECINGCRYCGFSKNNSIRRVTLTLSQVEQEARHLIKKGFRNILLVAGECPALAGRDYLLECVRHLRRLGVPSIHLETGPMEDNSYRSLAEEGAEGLVVYQETYHRDVYARMHPAGPKKDYDRRLACPDQAAVAGFRRVGLGILLGLADWRPDALAMAGHLDDLLKRHWQVFFTVSLPRLRPAAGEFRPPVKVTDRDMAQLVFALRIAFPQTGIVLSTRESPAFRDHMIGLGITLMSAGSHTEPGGYTGVGRKNLRRAADGGRRKRATGRIQSEGEYATGQFAVADNRPVEEVARRVRDLGYDPVWKDWDPALAGEGMAVNPGEYR